MSGEYIECSIELLRETIRGKANWVKCVDCEGTGSWHYNEDEEYPTNLENWDGEGNIEMCTTCDGVGYVLKPN